MEACLSSAYEKPPTSPANIDAPGDIHDPIERSATKQNESSRDDYQAPEVPEEDPNSTTNAWDLAAAEQVGMEPTTNQTSSLESNKDGMIIDSADAIAEPCQSFDAEEGQEVFDKVKSLEIGSADNEILSGVRQSAGNLPDDGEIQTASSPHFQFSGELKDGPQRLNGDVDIEQALLREGAIIENLSPKASRQVQNLIANVNAKKITPSVTVKKLKIDKKYVKYITQNPPTPLPRISRTTIQAFFTFLYLLTQRHWDSKLLKRKMRFFMRVEERLKFPSPLRHLTKKESFLSRLCKVMLDVAYEDWKQRGEGEWVIPPPIEDYDNEHSKFEDVVVPFIGWNKREDRELQAFDKLILLRGREDEEEGAARVKAGLKASPCSVKVRKLMKLTEDPPRLLERIKQLRTELDKEVLEMEELAKMNDDCQGLENMTEEEWIEYYTYYIPPCAKRGRPVGAKDSQPANVKKPVIGEAKDEDQATIVVESAPAAGDTVESNDKEAPSPSPSEPFSCQPNTAESLVCPEAASELPDLPLQKPKLRLVFITKPGNVRVTDKKPTMSAEKKRKLRDEDDFIDDDDDDEDYEERPKKKRSLKRGRRGGK